MWHDKTKFNSDAHRKNELKRFVNYYNWVKPHKGIDGMTPGEKLIDYFYPIHSKHVRDSYILDL
jgi:transposase InsO family protein